MADCPANAFHGCDSATCDRPCTARAVGITARQQPEIANLNRLGLLHAICAGFIVGIITLVALVVAVEAAKAGAENIKNTVQANKEP